MASILKVDTIQDQDGNNIINESGDTITIGASGDTITVPSGASLTVPNGGLTGQNYPAFEVYASTTTDGASDATLGRIEFDTELYDTDNCYSTSTYRFTPNKEGKYYVYSNILLQEEGNTATQLRTALARIYKNGSAIKGSRYDFNASDIRQFNAYIDGVVDLNGTTDYLEIYGYVNTVGGDNWEYVGLNGDVQRTYFGAYRIGA